MCICYFVHQRSGFQLKSWPSRLSKLDLVTYRCHNQHYTSVCKLDLVPWVLLLFSPLWSELVLIIFNSLPLEQRWSCVRELKLEVPSLEILCVFILSRKSALLLLLLAKLKCILYFQKVRTKAQSWILEAVYLTSQPVPSSGAVTHILLGTTAFLSCCFQAYCRWSCILLLSKDLLLGEVVVGSWDGAVLCSTLSRVHALCGRGEAGISCSFRSCSGPERCPEPLWWDCRAAVGCRVSAAFWMLELSLHASRSVKDKGQKRG